MLASEAKFQPALQRWRAPGAVALALTYAWLWLLTSAVTVTPPWPSEPMQIQLEPPPPPEPAASPARSRLSPRLITQPAAPQTTMPALPPPEETPPQAPVPDVPVIDNAPRVTSEPPPTSPAEVAAPLKIEPLSRLTRLPQSIHAVKPAYPETERALQRQARVVAEFVVDDRGAVRDIKIVQSAGTAFDQAVIDALRKMEFLPGTKGDQAVAARLRQVFNFELK